MGTETISQGITLTIPTSGTQNWGTSIKNNAWVPISAHDHSGSGNGKALREYTQQSLAPTGTTQTINWVNGNKVMLDLSSATGTVTATLSNPVEGSTYMIFVTQGATKRLITWPATVKWPQGEEPTQYHSINTVNSIVMHWDGTNYYCVNWQLDIS